MDNVRGKLSKQIEALGDAVSRDIYEQRKYLLGRTLTIVDAVSSDPEQRKAIKDLVNDLFYQGSYWSNIRREFEAFAEANGCKVFETSDPVEPQHFNRYKEIR